MGEGRVCGVPVVAVVQRDPQAALRQLHRDLPADAARPAGHKRSEIRGDFRYLFVRVLPMKSRFPIGTPFQRRMS